MKRRMPRAWQASSKAAWNSGRPSTWMARTGKGMRAVRRSRKPARGNPGKDLPRGET